MCAAAVEELEQQFGKFANDTGSLLDAEFGRLTWNLDQKMKQCKSLVNSVKQGEGVDSPVETQVVQQVQDVPHESKTHNNNKNKKKNKHNT